ncbi:MAG: FAD-binding protein [Alphaproteobacteria bacterium]|nr:FAD-binding protein [Alphaproteobacteria bacterium]MBU0795697.1 FAD-binding protein [Alphaproteobacteria bacterium]MBU0887320.1 FAD-binding protein [Alphaproteobacteria bacterium]MBU1811799.1 FAD-binding protein [Alphaproteobacteria bacterium]
MGVAAIRRNDARVEEAVAALKALLGDRLSTAQAILDQHGKDESYHPVMAPDAVAFAETTEEVAAIVKICAAHKVPMIPFGTGTSLEGGVAALQGGVTIDVSRMNRILEVNAQDLDCRVQAGVTRKQLNEHLRDTGLFFPIDPGADASLGGMASTRASGTNAVRYGTMRENVLSLTVVTADGRIIKTARRSKKSAAGYDLTRLFVGSEGTLGIITEVAVRLYGVPEQISSAVCAFPDLEGAVNSVILIIQSGIPVARMELLDEVQMGACIAYSKLEGYQAVPTLFFEFHGTVAGVAEQVEMVKSIAGDFGGADFKWATKAEERTALWEARHKAYYAALALRPGAKGWPTDVCVPISRLAECILETKKDIAESGMLAPLVGHVGDGNFHLVYVIDPENPAELATANALNDRMVLRALAMEGTCTGEHGIGYGKMDFLVAEAGEAVSVMRQIKLALDPDNLMNPGKILRI